MVDVSKEILIEENEMLKLRNSDLEKKVKELEKRLKSNLVKSSNLMMKLISIKANIDYCKKFNYTLDENFRKGYNKAFELIEKSLNTDGWEYEENLF